MSRLWSRSKPKLSRAADFRAISSRRQVFGDFSVPPTPHSLLPKSPDKFRATCSCSTAQIPTWPGCIRSVSFPSSDGAGSRGCLRRQPKPTPSAGAGERYSSKYARMIAARFGFTKHPVISILASAAATMGVTSTLCALRKCWRRNRVGLHESFTNNARLVSDSALWWTIADRAVAISVNSGYEKAAPDINRMTGLAAYSGLDLKGTRP